MKKALKISASAAIAMSAFAPVAAFADTKATAETGFYTQDTFMSGKAFRALSNSEKAKILKNPETVLVVGGKVYFAKDSIGKTDAQLDKIATSVADFEAKYGELTEKGYSTGDLKVTEVSAINATQVLIKFNEKLDKTTAEAEGNYKYNNALLSTYDGSATAVLQDDNKSVVVTFSASKNKSSFTFGVDGVKTSDKKVVKEFSGTVVVDDKEAPTVAKTEFLTNGNLEVTFSEPLKSGTAPIVRVDGKPVTGSVSGSKVVVTAAALTSADVTVNGGQTVSVFVADVFDTVGNEAALYNGTVKKVSDSENPTITSVTQAGQNKLKVVFSEALGASASGLGATEFKFLKGSTIYSSTAAILDSKDTTNKTYIVTFTESDIYGVTPVESQAVTLILNKDDVKDTAGNGNDEFSKSFTFNTDKTGPSFVSSEVASNKETFELTFDEEFTGTAAAVDESKIIVTDSNGVRYSVEDTSTIVKAGAGNEKVLLVDFIPASASSQKIANGKYTVTVKAGAIADAKGNDNSAAATTLTVGDAADTTKPVSVLNASSTSNKFIVDFGEEVTSSALQLSNYKLDGQALPVGTDIFFNGTNKNSVTIELPKGSQNIGVVGTGTAAVLNVANVADKAGNVAVNKNLSVLVSDNTSATLQSVQVLDNDIILTFDEKIDSATATAINTVAKLAAQFEIKVDGKLLNLGTQDSTATGGTNPAATVSLVSGNAKKVRIALTPVVIGTGGTLTNDGVVSNWNNTKPVTVKVKTATLKDSNLFLITEGTAVSK